MQGAETELVGHRADADHEIARDGGEREPARDHPHPGQHQEDTDQQQLVGCRVQHLAEPAGPAVALGEPAIQPVADGGDEYQHQRAFVLAGQEACQDRQDERNARQGDDVGQVPHAFGYYSARHD